MASRSRSIRCLAAVAIATGIAGCGSSSIRGALAPSQNKQIAGELSAVSDAVNSTSCGETRTALARLDQTLSGLPASTNAGLVSNLRQGAATLRALALRECRPQTTTTTTTTTSTSSATTPTAQTTPSTQVTTQTTVTTQTSAPDTNTLPGSGTVTSLPSTPSTPTPTPPAGSTGSGTNGAGSLGGG